MRTYKFLAFILFLLAFNNVSAQDLKNIKELADLQLKHEKFHPALDNYRLVEKDRPNDLDIKYKLGICLYKTGQVAPAEQYLLFAANQKGASKEAWYHLAKVYHLQAKYKNAISTYRKYLKEGGQRYKDIAKHSILQCANAQKIKYQEELAIVDNLGHKVNDKWNDYAPIVSPSRNNTIYFSSVRDGNSGGLRDEDGLQDEILGTFKADIFSTELVNGAWSAVRPLNDLINSSKDDVVLGFSDRATVMYYFKGFSDRNYGTIYTDTLRNTSQIVLPMPFKSPLKMEEGNQTPIIFNDSILIYAAEQEGGYGGLDLYVTKRIMGDFWTRPENLGPKINTPYDEKCPFLAKDGRTLYFSSNQKYSLGGFDIFKTIFRDDISDWTTPQNMGSPINSPADDLYFILNKDGLTGFFSSDRAGGLGGLDLYTAYFKSVQTEQLRTSNPIAFNLVKKAENQNIANHSQSSINTSHPPNLSTQEEILINPLFYDGDNILTKPNITELNKVVKALKNYPMAKVEITGYTDDSDPAKFRLYFSYIRAEKAAEFLQKNSIPAKQIIVKGFGANYKVAKNKLANGAVSTQGQKMNRRIELRILSEGTPVTSSIVWPIINETISSYERKSLDNHLKGLAYKVEIATLRTMYQNDVIQNYSDAMIDKDVNNGMLHYTIGWYKSYGSARSLLQQMQRKGIANAFIVAYLNGKRIYKTDAETLKTQYPDLENYIKGW